MDRNYYPIDEKEARTAHSMMSFSDYKEGSLTAEYRAKVDEVYELADKLAEERPDQAERGYALADRYARKMAENFNRDSRIGTMCPSVMISGAGNFPTNKKRKQVEAWDRNMKERQEIEKIKDKIISIINGKDIIKSGDADAVEKLEKKLETLEARQQMMKSANAYYKENGSLEGCHDLTDEQIAEINENMERCDWYSEKRPFQRFELSNNSQNIRNCRKRLERLKKAKKTGTQESEDENGLYKLIENKDIMRIQFRFDGKPSDEIRTILKAHGFRWSPHNMSWQRQLNGNGKYAASQVAKKIRELQEVGKNEES